MKLFRSSSSRSVSEDKTSSSKTSSSPRRRNFRFLRSVDQKKRMSTVSINKTRAHAKQLAMAYDAPPVDTPNSTSSSNVNLLSRTDATTPSPAKENNFFDPFGNGPQNQDPFHTSKLDKHFASGNKLQSKEPTASTVESFDTSSMGSELDFFSQQPSSNKPAKLDDFMGRQQQPKNFIAANSSANSNSVNALARRKIRSQSRMSSDHSVGSNYSASERGGGSVAGSFISQTSNNSSSGSNPNIFDMDRADGGFTFDAFGLDESQVERDLNNAMQELATDGIRGFSFFQQDSDQESEFAPQNWDSPSASRVSSPDDMTEAGFDDDGFKIATRSPQPHNRGKTPPRWEKQKPQHHHQQKGGFADFDNPWKGDPWSGSSDVHAPSETGASSVFGGAKSDFIPASSSSALKANVSKLPFSANKSDIDGGGVMLDSSSLEKLASPRSSTNSYRNSSPGYNGDVDYDDIDSEDGMQEDLAKEFAQEFVKRISPRHGSSPASSSSFGRPSDFSSQNREYSTDDYEESDYGGQSDFDQEHAAPSDSNYQRGSGAAQSQTPKSVSEAMSQKPKFRNFRHRYESSKVNQPETATPTPPVQSYRARAAQNQQEEVDQQSTPSKNTSYGSLKSSYAAAKATSGTSSQFGSRPGEEKKEDTDASSDVGGPKRGNLKAKWQKWENKSKASTSSAPAPGRSSPAPATQHQDIVVDDSDAQSVEMLTQETVERRNSLGEKAVGRKSDINKNAFSRLRRESEPASPSFANVTLRRAGNKSQLNDLVPDEDEDDDDDIGSPAAPTIISGPVSYRQQQAVVEPSSSDENLGSSAPGYQGEKPVQRKLTYRERREVELKREAEAKAKANAGSEKKTDTPKKDVAALIRKRIAANKRKAADEAKQSQSETSDFRSRLKPVQKSPQVQSRPESPEAADDHAATEANQNAPHTPSASSSRLSVSAQNELPPRPPSSSVLDSGHQLNQFVEEQSGSGPQGNLLDQATVVSLQAENADLQAKLKALENKLAAAPAPAPVAEEDPRKALGGLLAKRLSPTAKTSDSESKSDKPQDPRKMLGNLLAARGNPPPSGPAPKDPKAMLGNMLGARLGQPPAPKVDAPAANASGRPALKDDPKYSKYFKMMKLGMPKEQVQHAMQRDGMDPSILDGDPNQSAGLPLKEDLKYQKYFKMLKIGISMVQVKHALERDGLNPLVMDQDHNLPASAAEKLVAKKEPKKKDTHRRARLHWKTLGKVVRTSIWGKIDQDESMSCIDIDEDEFNDLFQAEIGKTKTPKSENKAKKGVAVRVIDGKRANNGGIILARFKMSHDEMADAVDRMAVEAFTPQQIESIIEYLPSKDERESLEKYMVQGGQDAAEKFNGLCECEKFMVSMMTVKHAKRKVNALLFKLQFASCLDSIAVDADLTEQACDALKNSNRLRQLLGIILQFGNRLNTAGSDDKNKAGAFTLDSLLKLSVTKAFDKKTTFLHYIVLVVQRNNELLLNFADDLQAVNNAERVYWDQCLSDLEDVENQLENVRRISLYEAKNKTPNYRRTKKSGGDDDSINEDNEMSLEEEVGALRSTQTGLFTLSAIKQVSALRDKVDSTARKFKKVLEYFGEDESNKQPHDLFDIFIKFSRDFKKAKEELARKQKKKEREERKKQKASNDNGKNGKPPSRPADNSGSRQSEGGVNKETKRGFDSSHKTQEAPRSWPKVQTYYRPEIPEKPVASTAASSGSPASSSPSSLPVDSKEAAKQNFRDQARHRRLRQMQDRGRVSGTPTKPVTSNLNRTPVKSPGVNRTPVKSPIVTGTPPKPPVAPTSSTTTPTSNRNLMRNRRRLMEERKRRSTPTDKSSPWQTSQAN